MSSPPLPLVTSFTLVWIKINGDAADFAAEFVTSFTLVWIKILKRTVMDDAAPGHELHARVD